MAQLVIASRGEVPCPPRVREEFPPGGALEARQSWKGWKDRTEHSSTGRRQTWVGPPEAGWGIRKPGSHRDRQKVVGREERSQELAHYKLRNPTPFPGDTEIAQRITVFMHSFLPVKQGQWRAARWVILTPILPFVLLGLLRQNDVAKLGHWKHLKSW